MALKKITWKELCNKIKNLKIGESYRFFTEFDGDENDMDECNASNGYLVSLLSYADSYCFMLGGYGNPTISRWLMNECDNFEKEAEAQILLNEYGPLFPNTNVSPNGEIYFYIVDETFENDFSVKD